MPFPPVPVRGVATFFPADTLRRNSPLALFSKIFPIKTQNYRSLRGRKIDIAPALGRLVASCKTM